MRNGPSVAVIDAERWPARHRSDHTNRGKARDLVTLLEGTQGPGWFSCGLIVPRRSRTGGAAAAAAAERAERGS